ncbi:acetolactate synthase, large subunit [Butyrivibrio sp. ob235]|uniref:biosynthetic-type acetolactate synthase large subunit n=1 Tax=Butyrivibrio sp. ob235 TaxID=1761780 RepID=UPI0008CCE77E|nr:biosynthetic-type acetolactate synthase large subunit [Butyrivibrio sp. ob235]SEK31351.1 acetolactate synthase, large subunit [Butyrivibrio sp. ob235]
MNGAQAIVKCLLEEKVDVVFGYSGVAIAPFYDALGETNIKQILIRTEQNSAHCASGYARISGKVGVCAVTSGPGATNLITGIATAYADSIPLVCITGQVNSELIGSDVFQEADITGAAESFVKYSYLIRDVNDIPRIFKEAFHIANTGRKGPVLIDIPIDIQQATINKFSYPEKVNMRTYKPTVEGNAAQIKKVVKEVAQAKRPIICVGGGVHLSGAVSEIRKFVKDNCIPVVSTMMGIGVMASEDPYYFGMVGNNGRPCANRALNESDLLLMVGARVADRAVNRPDLITENKVLIHIDVDPAEIGKNVGPTIPLVGDIKHIFKRINEFEDKEDLIHERTEWINTLKKYKQEMIEKRPVIDTTKFVDPMPFLQNLSRKLPSDAIYIADVGQNQIWSCRWHLVREGRFLTSGGMGTMGYSIPAAFGAKYAAKGKKVVAVMGDGAFQMSMMELSTLRQYGMNVGIIVFNNGYLGMVREYQHYSYDDRYNMVELHNTPKLDKIAEAYDMKYLRASSQAEAKVLIDELVKNDECVLCEVVVDPMDLAK